MRARRRLGDEAPIQSPRESHSVDEHKLAGARSQSMRNLRSIACSNTTKTRWEVCEIEAVEDER